MVESQSANLGNFFNKKAIYYVFYIALSAVCAVVIFFSALVVSVSLGATTENTVGLFGYKIYIAENDIEETDIKAGSLIIIKDTDTDDFYTPEYLSENAIVIKNLGHILSEYSTYIAIILMLPIALFFAIVIMREISKKVISREQKKLQTELDFSNAYVFEEDET